MACICRHARRQATMPNLLCSLALLSLWQSSRTALAVSQEPRVQGIGSDHMQDLFRQTDLQGPELQEQIAQQTKADGRGSQDNAVLVELQQEQLLPMTHKESKGTFSERQDNLPRKLIQGSSLPTITTLQAIAKLTPQPNGVLGAGTTLLPDPVSADTTYVHGGIPRIIHQVFLSGKEVLHQEEAASGSSSFHRDWRRSCQVHNPGWRYILWDEAMAEALLTKHYPWFLAQYTAMKERPVVVRGDAIRAFILHAYGGMYLDMDTECFGPSDVSLHGHSLVLQAELPWQVNNAQMASVRGHPFWVALQQRANDPAFYPSFMNGTHILMAAGPMAVSTLLRSYLSLAEGDNLPGAYLDSGILDTGSAACTAAGSHCEAAGDAGMTTVRVYARWEWFQACEWNKPACHAELAKCAPLVRAVLRARYIMSPDYAATLLPKVPEGYRPLPTSSDLLNLMRISNGYDAPNCSTPGHVARRLNKRRVPGTGCMCRFGAVVGAHHFSGSWTNHDNSAGRSGMAGKAATGLAQFFSTPSVFLEVGIASRSSTNEYASSLGQMEEDTVQLGSIRRTSRSASSQPRNAGPRQRFTWITNALDMLESEPGTSSPAGLTSQAQHASSTSQQQQDAASQETAAAPYPCHLLSITQVLHPASCAEPCPFREAEWQVRAAHDLARWAHRHGCSLTLITDLPTSHPLLTGILSIPSVTALQVKVNLGPQPGPMAGRYDDDDVVEGASSDDTAVDTDDVHSVQLSTGWADSDGQQDGDTDQMAGQAGSSADYGAVSQQELEDEDTARHLQQMMVQDVSIAASQGGLTVPSKTLEQILSDWHEQHQGSRLSLVHMSCPGNCTWVALQQLHATGSRALLDANAPVMLLDLGPITPTSQQLLLPTYQHLYQELGYVGHYHKFLSNLGSQSEGQSPAEAWRREVCESCCWTASICEEDVVVPAIRIGLIKQNSKQVVEWDF